MFIQYLQAIRSGTPVHRTRVCNFSPSEKKIALEVEAEAGTSSVAILIVIIFLSILSFAAVNLTHFAMFNLHRYRLEEKFQPPMEKEALKIIRLLYDDETPESESPLDIVCRYMDIRNKTPDDEYTGLPDYVKETYSPTLPGSNPEPPMQLTVDLEDLSSRLGVNWIDGPLIRHFLNINDNFKLFKDNDKAPKSQKALYVQEFNTFRDKLGFSLDIEEAYKEWLDDTAFTEGYFTGYGYFNINISEIYVLEQIYKLRIGDIGASGLKDKVQKYRYIDGKMGESVKDKARVEIDDDKTPKGYKFKKMTIADTLQGDLDNLYPLVTEQPAMNIHFMDRKLLEGLFEAYDVDKNRVTSFLDSIFDKDGTLIKDLSLKDLRLTLGNILERSIKKQPGKKQSDLEAEAFWLYRFYDFLGTYTWFWKITVKGIIFTDLLTGNELEPQLTWIIARVPQQDISVQDPKKLEFKILEKEFTVKKI